MTNDSGPYYGSGAKLLHWLLAIALLLVVPAALTFAGQAAAIRAEQIPAHASFGLVIMTLTLAGLAWRAVVAPPPPIAAPALSMKLSGMMHRAFYALILLQGGLGIWMASSSSRAIRTFNGLDLALLAPANAHIIATVRPIHHAIALLLGVLIVVHIAAALWHHFRHRDKVLIRMLPFSGTYRRIHTKDTLPKWRTPSKAHANWPNGRIK
jgi:superoxide oxidase